MDKNTKQSASELDCIDWKQVAEKLGIDVQKGLAKGYDIVSIDEFEEGELPRKLFLVMLRKSPEI